MTAQPPRAEAPPDDVLEPLARVLCQQGPPLALPAPSTTTTATRGSDALAHAHEILDKVALWGDGHSGVARLRLDARARGGLSSATVLLEHRDGALHLTVDGADPAAIAELRERLLARGLPLEEE